MLSVFIEVFEIEEKKEVKENVKLVLKVFEFAIKISYIFFDILVEV